MEKQKFKWRYLLLLLPIAIFFLFVDQGGTFYPSQIHVAGILLVGVLLELKKKKEMFILGNAFSTMLFVFGMINIYALPGTNTTTLMATSPLTILPSFSLVLLAYAVLSAIRVLYQLKKAPNQSTEEKEKHRLNLMLIPISYIASIGLFVLINRLVRTLLNFDDSSVIKESIIWDNWHKQNDILIFIGLVFIALSFISIPIMKWIEDKNKIRHP